MRKALLILGVCCLTGCASTESNLNQNQSKSLFKDHLFPSHIEYVIESESEVFDLNDDAKAFVNAHTRLGQTPAKNIRSLVQGIFDREYMGLTYENSATSTANKTFETGIANCISMTIMAYSMAQHAGLHTQFMHVDVPDYWTRRSGFSLMNGHVNLRILNHGMGEQVFQYSKYLTIDFDPQEMSRHFRAVAISRPEILAMFYNNRAAEALLEKDLARAYAYLKAAYQQDPLQDEVVVNLGVLYRFAGEYNLAEDAYIHASELDVQNYTSIENLAHLYRLKGYEKRASVLEQRVRRAREENPFYHFILGEEARARNELDTAIVHYRKALRLDRRNHESLFGMGVVMYQQGNLEEAERYMEMAAKRSKLNSDRQRYNGKLAYIQSAFKSRQAL